MRSALLAGACGALFALGLGWSGMTRPDEVHAFLDLSGVVNGTWRPTLVLVMVGAIATRALAGLLSRGLARPWLAPRFSDPAGRGLDARLVGGAALFGVGWGLAGRCPGPAVAGLGTGGVDVLVFVAATCAGLSLVDTVDRRAPTSPTPAPETRRGDTRTALRP